MGLVLKSSSTDGVTPGAATADAMRSELEARPATSPYRAKTMASISVDLPAPVGPSSREDAGRRKPVEVDVDRFCERTDRGEVESVQLHQALAPSRCACS